jgi:O-antigen ligase
LLFTKAAGLVFQKPIFGIGLGNFPLAQKSPFFSNFFLNFQPTHNIYILLITELGIPLFVIAVYFLINRVYKSWQKAVPSLRYSVIAVLVLGLVDHYWITSHQNILLIIFLSVLFSVKSKTEKYAK